MDNRQSGNFLLNVLDEPVMFNYVTNVPFEEKDQYSFWCDSDSVHYKDQANASLFPMIALIKQRILEQTGTVPITFGVNVK